MQDTLIVKVPFYDLDPMQIVWHGNYVKYFEKARCSFLEKRQMTYSDMEKYGYAFPVVSLKVKYIRPCTFGQDLKIETTLENCENCLIFKYKISDLKTGTKMCVGETKQMAVNLKTKESLYEIPEFCLKQLRIKK